LHIAEQLADNDEYGMFKMTEFNGDKDAKFEVIEMVTNEQQEPEEQKPLKDSTRMAEAITAADEDGTNSMPMTSSMTEDEYELKRVSSELYLGIRIGKRTNNSFYFEMFG
jgi:hypothetical protein